MILLLGQAASRTGREPLDGRCGRRLEQLAGLGPGELAEVFALGNLVGGWPGRHRHGKGDAFPPPAEARRLALEALPTLAEFELTVLLGRNLARAFGLEHLPILRLADPEWRRPRFAVVPHPSGVSHWWNEAANVRAAERFLRRLARVSSQLDT